jgi:hypothetical protein
LGATLKIYSAAGWQPKQISSTDCTDWVKRACPQMAQIFADEEESVGPQIAQIYTDLRGKKAFAI